MNTLKGSIRRRSVVFILSFLFVVLISSMASAQGTYAQKIKVEGEALPRGIINTSDGGNALLFEELGRRVLLRKVDAAGKKVWHRELHLKGQTDPSGFDVNILGGGVAELSDGGYILTGARDLGQLDSDPWLVKLTSAGRIEWQKRFAEDRFASILSSVVSSADGGFFAAGNRSLDLVGDILGSGDDGVIVASFDSSGDMRWGKVFNHDFQVSLFGKFFLPSLFITSDQELIVVSQLISSQTFVDAGTLVLKVDAGGNLLWKKFLEKNDPGFTSGAVTADGGCILLFSSNRVIRLSSNGDVLWKKRFLVDSKSSTGYSVTQSAGGGFAIAGLFLDGLFLTKLNSAGAVVSTVFSDSQAVGVPNFILRTRNSGYVVFGEDGGNSFLLKLNSNASLPGCNLLRTAKIEKRKFGALKTSSPAITTSDWTPRGGSLDISSKKVKVTSSSFCP